MTVTLRSSTDAMGRSENVNNDNELALTPIRNILLVSYHFPPDAEIGGVRPYQFARRLPNYGVNCWVLTVDPEFAERPENGFDPDYIPDRRIIRTRVDPSRFDRFVRMGSAAKRLCRLVDRSRLSKQNEDGSCIIQPLARSMRTEGILAWLWYPDQRAGWLKPALVEAEKLISRCHFDAVISTSPPRVAHLIAHNIACRHNLPWIMDLRDPWYGTWAADKDGSQLLTQMYERLFLRLSDRTSAIILNTNRLRDILSNRLPDLRDKLTVIPNGFDPGQTLSFVSPSAATKEFSIGYYGFVYNKRSAETFLKGLRLWLDRSCSEPNRVKVRFVGGGFETDAAKYIGPLNLDKIVELKPACSRRDAFKSMLSDFVLLLLANSQPVQIPAKTYEYLMAGKRILAIAERESATADLLRGDKNCKITETSESVAAALDEYWHSFLRREPDSVNHGDLLHTCDYEQRTAALANLIERVCQGSVP